MMKIKGTTVFPAAVVRALDTVEGVVNYVMIATSPAPLEDELEIVVAVEGGADAVCQRIRDVLRGLLKVTPSVRAAAVEDVLRLQDAGNSRKRRVFVDHRQGQAE